MKTNRTLAGAGLAALALGASALVSGGAVAHAAAGTVSIGVRGQLNVLAAAGSVNDVVIRIVDDAYVVRDATSGLTAGAGCTAIDPVSVECPVAAVQVVFVDAGDSDDTVSYDANGVTANLHGGDGHDRLSSTSSGVAWLVGGAGRDTLVGGPGNDLLDGGLGSDELSGGGGGGDTVSYIGRNVPVTADIDGLDDDGEAGESDLIRLDVENLVGGNAADVLTGSPGPNVLNGSAGNDILHGLAGDDLLQGTPGNDTLDGGPGPKWGPTGFTSDADILDGGVDRDAVDYSTRFLRLRVEIDDLANDGTDEPSLDLAERDKVSNVETISGGGGDDTLIARNASIHHTLNGNHGDDSLSTADNGYFDRLNGGTGSDICSGDGPFGVSKDDAVSC